MIRSITSFVVFGLSLSLAFSSVRAQAVEADASSPFHKVSVSSLPEAGMEGNLESFKTALQRQIAKCKQQDLNAKFRFGDRLVTRKKWCVDTNQRFLDLAKNVADFSELMHQARDQFEWYQTEGRDGKGEVLFTGYNSPTLHASLAPTSEYSVPLYKKPADLVQIVENGKMVWRRKNPDGSYSMHFSRKEIDLDNALKGRNLEIAYTTDFFSVSDLQTEGSGVLMLHHPDGTTERKFINYAASNGHPWVALSQILRQEGVSEEYLTVPGMREYFKLHPEKELPALVQNPSYVYFQFDTDGPYGSDSVLLSPRHSLAIDLRVFPQGAVTLFNTQRPEMKQKDLAGWKDFATLAVTQDTGGAIVGPGRVDIYWGDDDYAEQASGRMHQLGKLYIALLPE
jgi:membrane-bound lytic murein transglycosylase A